MILVAVVPMLVVLLVIRSARVRSQEKQQLLNEQAQGILGSGFGGTTAGPCLGPLLLIVLVYSFFCFLISRLVACLALALAGDQGSRVEPVGYWIPVGLRLIYK